MTPPIIALVDTRLERMLVAAILREPARLTSIPYFPAIDLADFQAAAAFGAVRNLEAAGAPIALDAVHAQLQAGHDLRGPHRPGETQVDTSWLQALYDEPLPPDPPVTGWAATLVRLAARRRAAILDAEPVPVDYPDDVDEFALRDVEPPLPPAPGSPDFERDDKGRIYCSQANIQLALTKLGLRLRYNEFAHSDHVEGLEGFGPELSELAISRIRLLIDSRYRFRIPKDFFVDVILDIAQASRFHPVRDYLDRLSWDGVQRIGSATAPSWLTTYAGAEDNEYTRAVGRIVLMAAVRRVRQPGCKFDEMLILEGDQGKNKSTALAVLAVSPTWFNDDIPLDGDTKHQMEATMGRWIVEAGELKGMSNADYNRLKAYLGRTCDESRLAYARRSVKVPRQHILIGSTNEQDGYLRDPTGARRQWPVRTKEFDLDAIRRDRDQMWAEAACAEASGESIRLSPSLYGAAAIEQEARKKVDPIHVALSEALGTITGKIRIADCYAILDLSPANVTHEQMTRIGQAMRACGWDRSRRRFDGTLEYAYVRGEDWERQTIINISGSGMYSRIHK